MKNNYLLVKLLLLFLALVVYYECEVEFFNLTLEIHQNEAKNNQNAVEGFASLLDRIIQANIIHEHFKLVKDDGSGIEEQEVFVDTIYIGYMPTCKDIKNDNVKLSWYFFNSKEGYMNHKTQIKLLLCPYDCDGIRMLKVASVDMIDKALIKSFDLVIHEIIEEDIFIENVLFNKSYSMTTPDYSRSIYDDNGMVKTQYIIDKPKRSHWINGAVQPIEIPDYE